jgi:uncharacterized protein (TIGR01777 family)
MNARAILISGASGFIGSHLVRRFSAGGATVWAWTRNVARTRARLGTQARVTGALADIPADAPIDCIVNLAGAPVIGPPWTDARRQLLIQSRVGTTEAVLAWCATRAQRPRVMVSASAIGFYGPAGDEWLDESSPPQEAFQSKMCVAREAATNGAAALGIRAVNLRIGLVLGADGGILPRLALPARLGMAAVIGDGQQWMSWIHLDDLERIVELALEDGNLSGPVNAVAPEPVRQRDFQRSLTRVLHRPLWLRVPGALLRAGLGDMAELLVRGQRVAPRRLLAQGFEFRHPALEPALAQILKPSRS